MGGGRIAFAVVLALVPSLLAACDPPPDDRAPDLRMARLADVSLDVTADGRRLLRFTTTIVNVGEGPFELNGTRSSGSPTMSVEQRVYDAGGGSRVRPTTASMYFSGDGHNHWHVRDLETYALARKDNGHRVGSGAKHGFCFWDNTPFQLWRAGAPQSPVYRGCGVAADTSVVLGQSVGWGDRYPATLPDQYIDVTGLGTGHYRLTATADDAGWFTEAHDGNNATWVDLRIRRRSVEVEAYGPSA